eukprot:FR740526.1.p3 GENE.FR740526.1~~FR740526.1.p3  ORF type:complete len:110 (-),score=45.58 FR740526.1:733-1062(-)
MLPPFWGTPQGFFTILVSGLLLLVGIGGGKTNFPPETSFGPGFAKRANLPFLKGTKKWSSPAVAAALEIVESLALDLGCHSLGRFFLFFFFFFFFSLIPELHSPKIPNS